MMAALHRPLGGPIPLAQLYGAQMRRQFDPLTHDPPHVGPRSHVIHKTGESIKRFWYYIDETWTNTNIAALRGWAPRGEWLKAKVPHRRWKTMTFLAALRHDRVEAPWLLDGPINGERFRLYVEKVLLPCPKPGDIVVMDNLGSHKGKAVRRLIRAAGAHQFFLPKYPPDLNPIEQLFAKLKHVLREAAARTVETVCQAIAQILDTVTSKECANYFAQAGYDRR
jgi:transposase